MELSEVKMAEQWRKIRRLYKNAFPKYERKPFSLIRLMHRKGRADVWIMEQEGQFAGFAVTMNAEDMVLLDYFAVIAEMRGKGVGSEALKQLQRHYLGKRLFLEIESIYNGMSDLAERKRRKHFYLSNGMREMRVLVDLFGTEMELLGWECKVEFQDYLRLYQKSLGKWAVKHVKELPYPDQVRIAEPLQSQLSALWRLWREAFGDTEACIRDFERTAFSRERCRCVTIGGEVAAALYWFNCRYKDKQIAYLYAVATAEAYRSRGICHLLMEDTHCHLAALGYDAVILVPESDPLFRFYQGMGYQLCSCLREFRCSAGDRVVSLTSVDAVTYGERRRSLLPEHAVIQEGENLAFLAALARLYAGDGFLLAAEETQDGLFIKEFLGDDTAAPGVVKALGYEEGTFRTHGGEKPFALYYPLGDCVLPQVYFGLAFD